MSGLKMSGAIPQLPLCAFVVCTGTTLLHVLLIIHKFPRKKGGKMEINQLMSLKPKTTGLKLRGIINW